MVTSDGSRFSRMDKVKFVDKKLLKIFEVIWSALADHIT